MPIITIEGPKINKETKSKLVNEMTDKASEVLNIPKNTITILIKENDMDNIGVGGKLLSDIHK